MMIFRPKLRQTPSAAGFTLLEILVAVAILGLAYLAIMQNFSYSLRNIERVDRRGARDFADVLALERNLMIIPGQLDVDPLPGEIYVAGQRLQLVLLEDPDHPGTHALILEKKE